MKKAASTKTMTVRVTVIQGINAPVIRAREIVFDGDMLDANSADQLAFSMVRSAITGVGSNISVWGRHVIEFTDLLKPAPATKKKKSNK